MPRTMARQSPSLYMAASLATRPEACTCLPPLLRLHVPSLPVHLRVTRSRILWGIAHEPRCLADKLSGLLAVLHLLAVLALVATYTSHAWDLQDVGDTPFRP